MSESTETTYFKYKLINVYIYSWLCSYVLVVDFFLNQAL